MTSRPRWSTTTAETRGKESLASDLGAVALHVARRSALEAPVRTLARDAGGDARLDEMDVDAREDGSRSPSLRVDSEHRSAPDASRGDPGSAGAAGAVGAAGAPHATTSTVFVGGLRFSIDERAVRDVFERHGEVLSVKIVTDHDTGRSRGCAFVTFAHPSDATSAADRVDGRDIDGRRVRCNLAHERGDRHADRDRRLWTRRPRDEHDRRDRDRHHPAEPRGERHPRDGSRPGSGPGERGRRGDASRSPERKRAREHKRHRSRSRSRERRRRRDDDDDDDDAPRPEADVESELGSMRARLQALEEALARAKAGERRQRARADALEKALERASGAREDRREEMASLARLAADASRLRAQARRADDVAEAAAEAARTALVAAMRGGVEGGGGQGEEEA
jgi:hypothetical protein